MLKGKNNFSAADIFENAQKGEQSYHKRCVSPRMKNIVKVLAVVLVFVLFAVFLVTQYSYAYMSHDDYGYATLSYVYWEEGMWGQDFSMQQMVHYLTEHYNRWGGRVLCFAQEILLFKAGTEVMQNFHAVVLLGIFLLAFLFAFHAKKVKHPFIAAAFTCLLFGFFGKTMAITGLYWYSASIAYMVPVLYLFVGAWLLYILLLDKNERLISLSKLMMLPFTCVLFFFAGFSMEQIGIFAVVTVSAMLIYASFYRRNPVILLYGVPPLISAVVGCHIMLAAVGNNSRKGIYAEYYSKSFTGQVLESAQTIVSTVFQPENLAFTVLIAAVGVLAAVFLWQRRKNAVSLVWLIFTAVLAGASVGISLLKEKSLWTTGFFWGYLIVVSVTVSVWLLGQKNKRDFFLWALFLGGIASQGACLISPIFPERCMLPFAFVWILISVRAFLELLSRMEEWPLKRSVIAVCAVMLPVLIVGGIGAGTIFAGFRENDRIQEYNHQRLLLEGEKYARQMQSTVPIPLMKLKDDTYAGSTQPYERDLIKDWMKIYYKLPRGLTYTDFAYEEYNEERLQELINALEEEQQRMDVR